LSELGELTGSAIDGASGATPEAGSAQMPSWESGATGAREAALGGAAPASATTQVGEGVAPSSGGSGTWPWLARGGVAGGWVKASAPAADKTAPASARSRRAASSSDEPSLARSSASLRERREANTWRLSVVALAAVAPLGCEPPAAGVVAECTRTAGKPTGALMLGSA
jgi:hypothetical protein